MKDLHTEPFKVRLIEQDADVVRALARKTGIKPAVLLRHWVKRELQRMSCSLPKPAEK